MSSKKKLLDWSGTGGFCCLLFGGWFALSFIVPDLSFWSRCLTMTILAQLNDCHCCNDARSLVPKKNSRPPKPIKPSASATRFLDWIGVCAADALQVWFQNTPAFVMCKSVVACHRAGQSDNNSTFLKVPAVSYNTRRSLNPARSAASSTHAWKKLLQRHLHSSYTEHEELRNHHQDFHVHWSFF